MGFPEDAAYSEASNHAEGFVRPASTTSGRSTGLSAAQQDLEREHRRPAEQTYPRGRRDDYHTHWVQRAAEADDPERIAIREALAFGKAVYDRRTTLSMTAAELARRAGMTVDEVECIEEGGTEPTVALLRRLAAALTPTFASPRPRLGLGRLRDPRCLRTLALDSTSG